MRTGPQFRFENPVVLGKEVLEKNDLFSPYWQRSLGDLAQFVNLLAAKRNTGVTEAVPTGAVISHGLNKIAGIPIFVSLTPLDGTPTDYYADSITATTFTIHFAGGGDHAFGWAAET